MRLKAIPKLLIGFFVIAIGIQMTILADLGMNPWGTFHQGVAKITPLSFGQVTQVTGLAVIIFSLFFKIKPGLGTVLNMLFIGAFVDFIKFFGLVPQPNALAFKILYLLVGMFLFNYGVYVYLSCRLGAGPRDGLLVGLVKITGKTVTTIRPLIEITVLVIGIILGGTFGIGTIINALAGGWMLQQIFDFHKFSPHH